MTAYCTLQVFTPTQEWLPVGEEGGSEDVRMVQPLKEKAQKLGASGKFSLLDQCAHPNPSDGRKGRRVLENLIWRQCHQLCVLSRW